VDQQAIMEAWARASAPGAGHEALEPTIGVWRAKTTVWFGDGPPNVTGGRVEKKWSLDGRFVEMRYEGDPGPHGVFRGVGLLGYNNIAKRYESIWIDVMSTAMLFQTGQYDAAKKALSIVGEQHESITGGTVRVRSVTTIRSKNEHVMENYVTGPDRREHRTLEVVQTRV
jgi:hypothetical protein